MDKRIGHIYKHSHKNGSISTYVSPHPLETSSQTQHISACDAAMVVYDLAFSVLDQRTSNHINPEINDNDNSQ